MQDVNSSIPLGSGCELRQVLAMKVVGQIVGTCTVRGQQRAFLLTP